MIMKSQLMRKCACCHSKLSKVNDYERNVQIMHIYLELCVNKIKKKSL